MLSSEAPPARPAPIVTPVGIKAVLAKKVGAAPPEAVRRLDSPAPVVDDLYAQSLQAAGADAEDGDEPVSPIAIGAQARLPTLTQPSALDFAYDPTLQPKRTRGQMVIRNLPGSQDPPQPLDQIDDLALDLDSVVAGGVMPNPPDEEEEEMEVFTAEDLEGQDLGTQSAENIEADLPAPHQESTSAAAAVIPEVKGGYSPFGGLPKPAFGEVGLSEAIAKALDDVASPIPSRARSRTTTLGGLQYQQQMQQQQRWKNVLERAITAIVSVRYAVPTAFDTYYPGVFSATGFVVDAARGLVLTNKHVVTDAPFLGKVAFRNAEETDARVVYADPVHDFGFLQYDPTQLKCLPELHAIQLAPEDVRVGMDIKVPGADAGEKLSILSGTIARIDRPCANYGKATYCDFNTFYIQASSNTSGGSSGSPVLNDKGHAVALNAGGSMVSASSFFLPLDRIIIALRALQESTAPGGPPAHVPRGTLQVEFVQKTYDQCRRMGVVMELETSFRAQNPALHGCLAVQKVLPGGPADGRLFPGDLLISVAGEQVAHFMHLAALLDSRVGGLVDIQVLRGGQIRDVIGLTVGDLHALVPNQMLNWGGDVFHAVSVHLARAYLHSVGGCMLVKEGTQFGVAGIPPHSVIVSIAQSPVRSLEDLVSVISRLPQGTRVPVRYYALAKKQVDQIKIVDIDRVFDTPHLWTRKAFQWTSKPVQYVEPPPRPLIRVHNEHGDPAEEEEYFPQLHAVPARSPLSRVLSNVQGSLVIVEFRSGFGINGLAINYAVGVGIVVDADRGLVLTDRMVCPTPLGRVTMCIGNSSIVPCRMLAMHPSANSVWLQYDPNHPHAKTLKAAPLLLPGTEGHDVSAFGVDSTSAASLGIGDSVTYVTASTITHVCSATETCVKSIGYMFFTEKYPPQHRTINFDRGIALDLQNSPTSSGVLCDDGGWVRAFWLGHRPCASYVGTLVEDLAPMLLALQEQIPVGGVALPLAPSKPLSKRADSGIVSSSTEAILQKPLDLPVVRVLDVELNEVHYWKALDCGVCPKWIRRAHSHAPEHYALVAVRRVAAGTPTADVLREMDILLEIDGQPVASMRDLTRILLPKPPQMSAKEGTTDSGEAEDEVSSIDSDEAEAGSEPEIAAPIEIYPRSPDMARLTVFRDGSEIHLRVPWVDLPTKLSVEAVVWCGAVLQPPHRALRMYARSVPEGLYVSVLYTGSPAHRDGLMSCLFVTEVNGHQVRTVDQFLQAVGEPNPKLQVNFASQGWMDALGKDEPRVSTADEAAAAPRHFRLTTVDLERVTRVIHIESHPTFFPTYVVHG